MEITQLTVYRIEHNHKGHGMWYNENGLYQPFIKTLTEGISADLPMDFSDRYYNNNRKWFSGTDSPEMLKHWFSIKDIEEMLAADFGLYKIENKEVIKEEFQVIFTQEGIIDKKRLDLKELFK